MSDGGFGVKRQKSKTNFGKMFTIRAPVIRKNLENEIPSGGSINMSAPRKKSVKISPDRPIKI
jgi:hypothetical protein